jgi:hypothetical protein
MLIEATPINLGVLRNGGAKWVGIGTVNHVLHAAGRTGVEVDGTASDVPELAVVMG